ncbi:type II toxin-antitoxin system Phd/YefM family antitoxin [Mycobacterium kyorinense]|nr:type II toxin-antitoxin system prevent-host-death family antitoxin [Mycobacterium kyorinense]
MKSTISQRELRNDSGTIMRRVERGDSFTVTRNGVPVADLVPHERTGAGERPRFVAIAEITAGAAGLPVWDAEHFAQELHALDDIVDDNDIDPWRNAR